MIPFSICAEITGAALAGSAGGIERQKGWGWARLPRVGQRAARPLAQAFRPGSGERPSLRGVQDRPRAQKA
jgi:hypothetical protein